MRYAFFFSFFFFLGEVFLAISLLDLTLVLEMRFKKKKNLLSILYLLQLCFGVVNAYNVVC